ncbi:MAG: SDR family oxidoreductase [Planctomycetota bacterium]
MRAFTDRAVWITGASSGIGAALARAFAREGACLVLSARSQPRLAEVQAACQALGGTAHLLPHDLAQHATLPHKARAALRLAGRIDLLVNNAGIGQRATALDTSLAVVERILSVNFLGAVALTRAVLPHMIEQGGGHIAVVTSVLGKFGARTRSAYAASKHALHGYFDSLRAELGDRNIRVTLLCLGYVRSEVSIHALDGDGAEHGRMDRGQARGMDPDRCARAMIRAVQKGREEVVIGGLLERGAVWLKRLAPGVLSRLLAGWDPD